MLTKEAQVPYTAEISRSNPTAFVFLVDQSASMEEPVGGAQEIQRKCDAVADALNRLLYELTIRCAKEEGVRDYFHVAVVGYGAGVDSALPGSLRGRDLIPIGEVANAPARIEDRTRRVSDGAGGLVEQSFKFPTWVDPVAGNGTPMSGALARAQAIVEGWLRDHPGCFPPVVLNLTDGESTDGDPSRSADAVRSLTSGDGAVLMFNLHVSSDRSPPVTFPDSDAGLPNEYAKLLFTMSSVLPDPLRAYAQQQGFNVSAAARGFVFNADATSVVQFLDIGTRATDLR
jgi:hypothetical protein